MRRSVVAVLGAVAMLLGGVMFASPAMADESAGLPVFEVNRDGSITLYAPIMNVEASWAYKISDSLTNEVFRCGGGTGYEGTLCADPEIVYLPNGRYTLDFIVGDESVVTHNIAITGGDDPTPTPTPTPTPKPTAKPTVKPSVAPVFGAPKTGVEGSSGVPLVVAGVGAVVLAGVVVRRRWSN